MFAKRIIILLALLVNLSFFAEAQTEYPVMSYDTKDKLGTTCHCTVYASYLQVYAFETCLMHKDLLQLTEDQIKTLTAMQPVYDARIKSQQDKLSKAERDLNALITAKTRDDKKTAEKSEEIQALQNDLQKTYSEIKQKIENMLTAKQREILYSIYF